MRALRLTQTVTLCLLLAQLPACATAPARFQELAPERAPEAPFDPRYPARVETQRQARGAKTHEWLWQGMYRVRSLVPCTNGPIEIPIEWPRGTFGVAVSVSAWSNGLSDLDAVVDMQFGDQVVMLKRFRPRDDVAARLKACQATTATSAPASAGPVADGSGAPRTSPSAPVDAEPVRLPVATRPWTDPGSMPTSGSVLGEGWFSNERGLPAHFVDPEMPSQQYTTVGADLGASTAVVRVWLPVAQDLTDLVFEVSLMELRPRVPTEEFLAKVRTATTAQEERDAKRRADFRAACASKPLTDAACWLQPGSAAALRLATRPPPPPRAEALPPAPTATAEWLPGTWRWDGSKYDWVGGFWREPSVQPQVRAPPVVAVTTPTRPKPPAPVKPSSNTFAPEPVVTTTVEASLPVTLPAQVPATPAVLVEVPPPAPAADVEWVPGFWSWRGAWVWVPGRWHPLPFSGARWAPPRITIGATGVKVELPGGWIPGR